VFRLNANAIQEALSGILGAGISEETSEVQAQPDADKQQPAEPAVFDYKVVSIKPSGKSSLLLELEDKNGKVTAAYIKADDRNITVGSCLRNVDIEQKTSNYGDYNLINACQVAA